MKKLSAKRQAEIDALPTMSPCDFCPLPEGGPDCPTCIFNTGFRKMMEKDKTKKEIQK